jgi:hypothetical protein
MAKRKKKITKAERETRRQQRDEQELTAMVDEMTGHYTCSVEVAREFAVACEDRQVELEFDLATTGLALELWRGRPGAAERIVDLLDELEAATQRQRDILADLSARFAAVAEEQVEHVHLEPVADYRAKVLELFSPDQLAADDVGRLQH